MKGKNAAVGFVFVILLVDVIGISIIIPVLPDLIKELTGAETSDAAVEGGWLLVAYSGMQFLFAPLMGALSDRFGRKPILVLSTLGLGLDFLLMAYAPTLTWLFLGRIIAGIMGASFSTGSAYIADVSAPEKRSQNFGLIGVAFGVGFIIGPVIGGLLGEYGSRIPFMAAAGLSLLNWLYAMFVLPESLPVSSRRSFEWKRANPIGNLISLKRYPLILGVLFSLIFVYVASHAVQSTWSFYTMESFDWSPGDIGFSLGFVGVLSAIIQGGLIRIVIPKLGQEKSIYIGMVLYAVGLVLMAFTNQGWLLYPYLIIYCLGGIAGPALQGLLSTQVPDTEQGELQGALTSMMSLTAIVGPLVMTWLFSEFSGTDAEVYFPGAPMLLGACLVLIGLFFSWNTLRKNRASFQLKPNSK